MAHPLNKFTPLVSCAVNMYAKNIEETDSFNAPTLASILQNYLHAGDMSEMDTDIDTLSQGAHHIIEQLFLTLCGWTPQTLLDDTGDPDCVSDRIEEEMSNDSECPFRETTRFIHALEKSSQEEQLEANRILKRWFGGYDMLDCINSKLLPVIVKKHKAAAATIL